MAMVLDAFASYLGDLLKQVAQDELGMLLGVPGEIEKMGDKLGDLKNFLADAERRRINDRSVQGWVTELKRAIYDATDIVDLCQLKAMERGPSTPDMGCFNPLLFCLRDPMHAHDIGSRIKALNQRLDDIKERSAAFNFNLGSYEDRGSKVIASANRDRETSGEIDLSGVVGEKIEEDTRRLVEIMLTEKEGNRNMMVVAIVGVGGIGKTTLAQKVFNDETIQSEFDEKIWLSVNQDFDKAELLRTAITFAGGDHNGAEALAVLQPTLTATLRAKKILLVMDDVWNERAWEGVLKIPLVNAAAPGSRVLVTTRNESVARGMTAVQPYHHIDKLEDEDAWLLLKKQVVSSEIDEPEIDMLKDIGLKIIAKCGGLPLAVKVMGGLLRQRGRLSCDWEQVLDVSLWSVSEMPQELNYAVYLSYEDLPPYLKQCFLYYSLLPKNQRFDAFIVVAMWISEGFIHGNSNDLEQLGRDYLNELMSRNLIEQYKFQADTQFHSMHDVVRSFAQYMARDEALTAHNEGIDIFSKLNSEKFLQLSIETKGLQLEELEWRSLQGQKSVRTLISIGQIKMKPGDSLVTFSSLRTLHIESANVATLVESLHQLKHLRYLALINTDISALPRNIAKMKLLQYISVRGCGHLVKLPDSIVKLDHLRFLNLARISKNADIPRGFCALTNMRRLSGFQAHMDGDWCSLEELGPLSQLRLLSVHYLENVSTASSAANARLGEKKHLTDMFLSCTSRLGHDGLVKEKEGVPEEEQQQIEKVFDELCPPPRLENLDIDGYFGQRLPRWMLLTEAMPLNNLRILKMSDLACCTQLSNALCQLPYLQLIAIARAPSIKRVGPEFLHPSRAAAAFPRLEKMILEGMVEWEEWEWEEHVQAMHILKYLRLHCCKLKCVPPGLAFHARTLRTIVVSRVQHLNSLENFASLVELQVSHNPDLGRITNLPHLQKLTIMNCPKMKVLEGVPALQRLVLKDYGMEELPEYMRDIKPRHLQLDCRLWLLASVAAGQSGPEWDKFSHVEHVKAYTCYRDNPRKWYVLYTKDPYSLETNISHSISAETLSSSMVDAQGFESVYKMRISTFNYVCSLVKVPLFEDMMVMGHTFLDGRVLSLEDQVTIALRALNSGEPLATVESSVGVNESTVSLVTKRFVWAMHYRAGHHLRWPDSVEMEKIKSEFNKIHGLPNCCGVVHTTHITFGPNCDHEKSDSVLMQALVDPTMRFTNIWLKSSENMDQSSLLHNSLLFNECKKGAWLNGRKLKVSDGSDVGEYIIGDAGYPLLPWLLTPYQENDLSDSPYQAEFNKRHSEATAMVLRVLARLKDTWKCLHRGLWHPENLTELLAAIFVCCTLHNIVIDMEEAHRSRYHQVNYSKQMRQLADEDAVMVRDILSQHLIESGETLSSSMVDAQGFESVYKMRISTFHYVCSLVKVPLFEDMMVMGHTFLDGRVLSLEDQVTIALRALNSGEPLATVGSSVGVNESTVSLVTKRFVWAMGHRARHHLRWPDSGEMEEIKSEFNKIHGLPNCCGVVHTTHITFVSNCDHEKNDSVLMQALVDPHMRFTNICLGPSASMDQSSLLHDSWLFKECKKGACFNGSKLKVSDGSDVGEYIIGDAGYPLLPWLLTPYQENDLSHFPYQAEFNKRCSEATAIVPRVLERLKDTWKCLHRGLWRLENPSELCQAIYACCTLHNIVIDMEEARMSRYHQVNCSKQVRQLADEDAVMVRDVLSQHLIESGVDPVDEEEEQEVVSSGSGDREEQEAHATTAQGDNAS